MIDPFKQQLVVHNTNTSFHRYYKTDHIGRYNHWHLQLRGQKKKRKPLITGLCDVGRRNVHAGREGEAKSLLAYQLAVCSAAGNGTQVFNSIELDGKVIPAMNVVGGGNVLIVDEDSTSRGVKVKI